MEWRPKLLIRHEILEEEIKHGRTLYTLAALIILIASPMAKHHKTHLGVSPSDMISLWANLTPGSQAPLQLVGADGNLTGDFVLPPNTVLIVTDLLVSVNLVGAPGQTRGGLINQADTGASRPYFSFDTSQQGSQTIHMTAGVVWNQAPLAINADDSSSAVFISVYGYLVKTQ